MSTLERSRASRRDDPDRPPPAPVDPSAAEEPRYGVQAFDRWWKQRLSGVSAYRYGERTTDARAAHAAGVPPQPSMLLMLITVPLTRFRPIPPHK